MWHIRTHHGKKINYKDNFKNIETSIKNKIALPTNVRLPSDVSSSKLNIGKQLFYTFIFQGTEKTITDMESATLEGTSWSGLQG